jgi:hypothetical protein
VFCLAAADAIFCQNFGTIILRSHFSARLP